MREGSGRIGTGGIRIQIEANPKLENRNSKLETRKPGIGAGGARLRRPVPFWDGEWGGVGLDLPAGIRRTRIGRKGGAGAPHSKGGLGSTR
jgi:hypothetical protein